MVYFRIMEGRLTTGTEVKLMASGAKYKVIEVRPSGAAGLCPV